MLMKKKRISPEETRRRLVLAGLHLFGVKGFEATRTRELADKAEVNQAAIPYHFGGKEGLYLAVAKFVVQRGQEQMGPAAQDVVDRLQAGPVVPAEAVRVLIGFLHGFFDQIVMADDLNDRSRFIIREYTTPGAGFDILYSGMLERMHQLLCELVAIVMARPAESEDVILKAHTLFGTVISNVMARNVLFRRLGWDKYTPERVNSIKQAIEEVVTSGLSQYTE